MGIFIEAGGGDLNDAGLTGLQRLANSRNHPVASLPVGDGIAGLTSEVLARIHAMAAPTQPGNRGDNTLAKVEEQERQYQRQPVELFPQGPKRRKSHPVRNAALALLTVTTAAGFVLGERTGIIPPIPGNQNHTTQVGGNESQQATTGATKAPEASPYATAEQVNQAIADMQKAAINNPALKKQLEQDAANVQARHVGMTVKLGAPNGIENSGGKDSGAAIGLMLERAIRISQSDTVFLSYSEDSRGNIVVLPILYSGNHQLNLDLVDHSISTLSAQEIAKLINDGVSNHKIYFALLALTLDTSANDSQLHRTANTATADGLVGLKPMPTYDVANLNSLPNLEGGTNVVDLNIYTLDPQQG